MSRWQRCNFLYSETNNNGSFCIGKAAQRLLWKSQYVPFDGIPFVNLGSRAIVMECQFGARRQLAAAVAATNMAAAAAADGTAKPRITNLMSIFGDTKKRKQGEIDENFKECCPARYVMAFDLMEVS